MSVKDIYIKLTEINKEFEEAVKVSMNNFIDSAKQMVGVVSSERLPFAKKTFVCEQTGRTWSGRGRPPHWVLQQLDKK
jgi:DNA-binding protein H-NS